ncbi:MAG: HD domain-containing protein, partial [Lachnospiraceae bacterium]|nr:HD domain-containing protein [Lachnospiraceae bacterium]
MIVYYYVAFILAFVLSGLYVYRWHKHFDINISVLFILVPIVNLAFVMMYRTGTDSVMMVTTKILYLGGAYLPWFITMAIANLCKMKVSRFLRVISFILNSVIYCTVLTIGHSPVFYKSFHMEEINGVMVAFKEYGAMHTVFYIMVIAYQIAGIAVIVYSFFKKKQVSRKILGLLILPQIVSLVGYLLNKVFPAGFDSLAGTYVFAQIIYLLIADQIALYDVSDMVVESMVEAGETGFITVDFDYHYLGSNETAKKILPELNKLAVDEQLQFNGKAGRRIIKWIEHFLEDHSNDTFLYERVVPGEETQYYKVNVNYLYDGNFCRGYQIFMEDDTKNQQYIHLQDNYNTDLENELAVKTERIVRMHDNLILSMATMVESRDNSTGGHIKRTSEGVRILIAEMQNDSSFSLSKEFCKDIIKAAPMHDLGKIAVDDSILRKPGRFTPEEFEIMKTHAAEGARIVHEILKETDDESFKIVAENVAHYHHERVDGSGYPEGLKGDEIPLEARIMAIADVYDALVSKRVY